MSTQKKLSDLSEKERREFFDRLEKKFIKEATNTLIKMSPSPHFGTALLPDDDF